MTRYHSRRTSMAAVAVVFGILFAAGCAETDPTRFYTLSNVSASPATASAAVRPVAVGVGPISLPQYLDRPQVVRRAGSNTFQLAEFDKWGEPLEDMFPRILAENLSTLLASDRVFVIPRRRSPTVDYQVEIEVLRFDADVGGDAVLVARWEIFDRDGKQIRLDKTTVSQPVSGQGYEPVVAAMSATVADFSQQLARTIQSLPPGR